MTDFFLSPDDDTERPARRPRAVPMGLSDMSEIPKTRPGKPDHAPADAPCLLCGAMILSGQTTDGHTVHLDMSIPCYAPVWANKAPQPTLLPSRAYPVHTCSGACPGRHGGV